MTGTARGTALEGRDEIICKLGENVVLFHEELRIGGVCVARHSASIFASDWGIQERLVFGVLVLSDLR